MKILIICDPEEGRATEVCLFLKIEAERIGRRVVLLNAADDSKAPVSFDAVVVAATLRNKSYGTTVENYLTMYKQELNNLPLFFLSVVECLDENNLQVPDELKVLASRCLSEIGVKAQLIMQVTVGSRFEHNQYVTFADWPKLKLALQQFVIKNDLMMAG